MGKLENGESMEAIDEMIESAKRVRCSAYAPYSNYQVGACIRTENDTLFAGCNVENVAYPAGQCAEANAIGTMVSQGERKIKDVVIVVDDKNLCPPCGGCRQRLSEFSSPQTRIHLYNVIGDHRTFTMAELLPVPFERSDSARA